MSMSMSSVADAVSAKTESKSEKSSTKGQLACKCEAEFQLLEHDGETITGRDLRSLSFLMVQATVKSCTSVKHRVYKHFPSLKPFDQLKIGLRLVA